MLTKIAPEALNLNAFQAIGKQWMLVTAGTPECCNTMTASWGGIGILWAKPVATAYIRPSRYTKEFVDSSEYFTLSFLPESHRESLVYCGTVSGRDEDKILHCGFTTLTAECGAPYIGEAEVVLICRKLYCQTMREECFIDSAEVEQFYPDREFHDLYIGEIVEAYHNI